MTGNIGRHARPDSQPVNGMNRQQREEAAAYAAALEKMDLPDLIAQLATQHGDAPFGADVGYREEYGDTRQPGEMAPMLELRRDPSDGGKSADVWSRIPDFEDKGSQMNTLSKIRAKPRDAAKALKRFGRKGDTELVHVNPTEVAMLEARSGNRTKNRKTGLRQFYDVGENGGNMETGGTIDNSGDTGGYGAHAAAIEQMGGKATGRGDILSMIGLGLRDRLSTGNKFADAFAGKVNPAANVLDMLAGVSWGDGVANSGGGDNGSGMGGEGGGSDTGGTNTGSGKPPAPPAKFGSDRPRVIGGSGAGGRSSDRIGNLIDSFRKGGLGGGNKGAGVLGNLQRIIAGKRGGGINDEGGRGPLLPTDGVTPLPRSINNLGGGAATGGTPAALAELVAAQGRRGDTGIANLTPDQIAMLKKAGGSGWTNPQTGLREFAPPPGKLSTTQAPSGDAYVDPGGGGGGNGGSDTLVPPTDGNYLTEFDSLAGQAGALSGPNELRGSQYQGIASKRDALLGRGTDEQLRGVYDKYYRATAGGGDYSRDALFNTIKAGDQKFYSSLGRTPDDIVRPPGGGGVGGGVGGGGGTGTGTGSTNAGRTGMEAMFPGSTNGTLGTIDNRNPQAEAMALQRWIEQQTANAGGVRSPGPPVQNAVNAAQSPWTNLTRAPVRSRRFRSRRAPYEGPALYR